MGGPREARTGEQEESMRKHLSWMFAAALAAGGCAATKAAPKESAPPAPPTEAEQAAEMAAWMKYMTPGEEHLRMAADSGEWTSAGKFWMAPGTEPMEATGKAVFSMILGGRYQKMEYSSSFMGMEMEGLGITGFDNATKEYTSAWMDSMGTGTFITRGKYVDKNRMEFTGEMVDPMGDRMHCREVMVSARDTMVMEMFITHPKYGGEFKMMELTFTRVK